MNEDRERNSLYFPLLLLLRKMATGYDITTKGKSVSICLLRQRRNWTIAPDAERSLSNAVHN